MMKQSEPVHEKNPKISPAQAPKPIPEDISIEKPVPDKKKQHTLKAKKEREKKEIEQHLLLAKQYLAEQKYDSVIDITKKIQTIDPANKESRSLENEAGYMAGKALYSKHQYVASLNMFKNVNENYKDVKDIVASIKTTLEKKAEIHYKQGVKYFINEELKKAIAEWEKTLLLNPDHSKAVKDIENAKHLLTELEKIK